jgi:disulfide oxidoreductase YuzD
MLPVAKTDYDWLNGSVKLRYGNKMAIFRFFQKCYLQLLNAYISANISY